MKTFPAYVATMMGLGAVPLAPGTAASLATFLVLLPLRGSSLLQLAIAIALAAAGVWSSGKTAAMLGERDPKRVVIDEAAGMALILALLPGASLMTLVAGLLLFRVFDVLKPFPLRNLERLQGGWGIVADDLGAAFYTLAVILLARAALPI